MNKNPFSSCRALKSGRFSILGVLLMALAILVNPILAHSADKLMVQDSGGNIKFSARDDGSIMLNSNTFYGPSWALIYGSSNNNNTGLALDSYGSTAALGGGGIFRYARGTQAAPSAVQNGDRLGFFVFGGYDGTNFLNTAGLTVKVDGAVSTGSVPAKLVFETLATGSPRLERMVISSNGNVVIGGDTGSGIPAHSQPLYMGSGAYVTTGGVWTNASSREYKENINTLTREEANQVLDGLTPVKYNYKTDKEDKHVGFIAEDVPELVATKDRKGLSPMDIVAVLTSVVQDEKNTISEQAKMIDELSKKLDVMQREINRVKGMNMVGNM